MGREKNSETGKKGKNQKAIDNKNENKLYLKIYLDINFLEKEEINDDFNFLIHSLEGRILLKVFNNKELSPFIF